MNKWSAIFLIICLICVTLVVCTGLAVGAPPDTMKDLFTLFGVVLGSAYGLALIIHFFE